MSNASLSFGPALDYRPNWRLLGIISGLFALLQLITFTRIYATHQLNGWEFNWNTEVWDRFVAWSIGVVFTLIIIETTRFLLSKNWAWPRILIFHVVFALFISFVWYYIFLFFTYLFCTGDDCKPPGADYIYWYIINFDKLFLLYLITVSTTYTYYYVRRDNQHRLQRSRMETQLLETRLKMLRSQLHPHFLFNTLNSVASLMDINPAKAQVMLADLSDLLRQVLDRQDMQLVPLAEEMELLRKYVDIEKTRFSDDLTVDWQVSPQLSGVRVPTLLLQPLVENAIRHGFSRDNLHLDIQIVAERRNGHVLFQVNDNGKGLVDHLGADIFEKGTGLYNTRERLRTIYGDQFSFEVTDTQPGVSSRIVLPLQPGERL